MTFFVTGAAGFIGSNLVDRLLGGGHRVVGYDDLSTGQMKFLEAASRQGMRANGIKRIAFSSTGSIYGESELFPTPETAPFPVQTSLYGAAKLAGEGLIEAYCEGYGFEGYIFRFVSILGERYTHGHVFDFYKQLLEPAAGRADDESLVDAQGWGQRL